MHLLRCMMDRMERTMCSCIAIAWKSRFYSSRSYVHSGPSERLFIQIIDVMEWRE